MKKKITCSLLACIFSLCCFFTAHAQKWIPLFNGKNLNGWHAVPGGTWEVKKGIISGMSTAAEPKHGILISDSVFSDFEIEISYKAVKGNSGLYFRAEQVTDAVSIYGLQAEIDPEKDAGGLYETGGRGWVIQPSPDKVKTWYKPGQWNTMKVRAVGRDIKVWVNGKESAHIINDTGRTAGRIGLQLHGGMDMEVYFRTVRIKLLEEKP